jgi:hypothetical protein
MCSLCLLLLSLLRALVDVELRISKENHRHYIYTDCTEAVVSSADNGRYFAFVAKSELVNDVK